MIYQTIEELKNIAGIEFGEDRISIRDKNLFQRKMVFDLMDTLILGDSPEAKALGFQVVRSAALAFGVVPLSIQPVYEAKSREGLIDFTVPAMNLRTLTFDLARAVFRSAAKIDAGTFIFEIARSEMDYTDQPPIEYTASIILAAIREGYSGPVFIQGDHFQVKSKNFRKDREQEIQALKTLILDAMDAGFYNIDIDSSTLVDLSFDSVEEQQRLNSEVCAELAGFIRDNQPEGLDVSIGGEIGEVGGVNSTPEELRAFMDGFNTLLAEKKGLSKVSIQTGTSHGGIVLPDGSLADVSIDFKTMKTLSSIAREDYGMAGVVQHGASTLPKEAFHNFPQNECAEVHLATQFQNVIYDLMPGEIREEIFVWLRENMTGERKPDLTDDQFLYKTRKKALGPFKREIYSLPQDWKDRISTSMETEFDFLFDKLNIKGSREFVDEYIQIC